MTTKKGAVLLAVGVGTGIGSLAADPIQNPNASLVFPAEAWQVATPASQGMDPSKTQAAIDHVRAVTGKDGTDQMLIVRNGYMVWQGPDVARQQRVWSCTKSFLSTCVGLAWDDGRLTPDTLAKDVLPQLSALYPTVTVAQLGTFTSGYAFEGTNVLTPATPLYAPGTAFNYSRESDLLAALVTRVEGRSLEALFRDRIGNHIGITPDDMTWESFGKDGAVDLFGGSGTPGCSVLINALAMARFGWLFANDGVWAGQRLISQRYIDYATVARTSTNTPPHDPKAWYIHLPGNYGLNWWTNGMLPEGGRLWPHAPARTFAAQGNNNNNCFIIPEWHLVVVRLGQDAIVDMKVYDRMFALLGEALSANR